MPQFGTAIIEKSKGAVQLPKSQSEEHGRDIGFPDTFSMESGILNSFANHPNIENVESVMHDWVSK